MTLRNGDYEIHGDSITIRKEVLEKWRDHYHMKGREKSEADGPTWQSWYYWGKADVFVDLLKLFEELEP